MKSGQLELFSRHPEKYIHTIIQGAFEKLAESHHLSHPTPFPHFELETKEIATFGDFSTNAPFLYAPLFKKSPLEIAQEISISIQQSLSSEFKEYIHIEVAGGGFLNFFITPSGWARIAQKLSSPAPRKRFFKKKIIIEFSSPNIAKPMSIGHLRATILGNALVHLYNHMGYKTIAWNHLGDWGTQFGKLLVAYKKWGDHTVIEKDPITELQKLYVRFHEEAKDDPSLEDEARKEFNDLEKGHSANRRIWKYIVDQSLKEFQRMYAALDVRFDYIIGESFYESRLTPFIQKLLRSGKATTSDGATIVSLDSYHLPPGLIQKSDGATLYLTRDLVSLLYRARKIHPVRMLYIVGNEQSLHFQQLQAINSILKLTTIPFEHVSFGMVLNSLGKKFSTRKGDIVTADEVFTEVLAHAKDTQKEKQTNQSNTQLDQTAQTVSSGVIKYSMLRSNRTSNISFDFDSLFSLSGNSFPYLQYTYARVMSILAKAPRQNTARAYNQLTKTDYELMRSLVRFEAAIEASASSQSLHHLAEYLFTLANNINTLYEKSHILSDSNVATRSARIQLLTTAARTIRYGLGILGITVQEKM